MVDYSAYNVDPLKYQQAAFNNLQSAYAMKAAKEQALKENQMRMDEAAANNAYRQRMLQDEMTRANMVNARENERIELSKRSAKQSEDEIRLKKFGQILNYAQTAGGNADDKKRIFRANVKAAGLEDIFGEGTDWEASFNQDGSMELPVGESWEKSSGTVTVKGSQDSLAAFSQEMSRNPNFLKDPKQLSAFVAKHPVEFQYNERKKTGNTDDVLKYKKYQDELFDNFRSSTEQNALGMAGITGDVKSGYFMDGGDDGVGGRIKIPAGREAAAIIKEQRLRANDIRKFAKEKNIPDLNEAALQYEILEAQVMKQIEAEKASEENDADSLRNRSSAYTPKQSGVAEVQRQETSGEGANHPVSRTINESIESGSRAFSEWNKRRREAVERIKNIR